MNKFNRILCLAAAISAMTLLPLAPIYAAVSLTARRRIFNDPRRVPHNSVGLLLAISPVGDYDYFLARCHAAARLYHSGRIDRIIASGGDYTTTKGYNEIKAMYDTLLDENVPPEAITLDYDGQRTLKSIQNIASKFNLRRVTIISQKYHIERAIAQARHYDIDAVGYIAPMSGHLKLDAKSYAREILARPKMLLDFATTRPTPPQ